jgi:hypothetical protein
MLIALTSLALLGVVAISGSMYSAAMAELLLQR